MLLEMSLFCACCWRYRKNQADNSSNIQSDQEHGPDIPTVSFPNILELWY